LNVVNEVLGTIVGGIDCLEKGIRGKNNPQQGMKRSSGEERGVIGGYREKTGKSDNKIENLHQITKRRCRGGALVWKVRMLT